jgi:hypothetical protein
MRDFTSSIVTSMALAPQTVTTSANVGEAIDRKGYESALITCFLSDDSAATSVPITVTFKIQECATTVSASFSDILDRVNDPDATMYSAAITGTNIHHDFQVDLLGVKRYIRVVATVVAQAATNYITLGAVAVLGEPRNLPQTK